MTFPAHKCALHLTHNEHLSYYMTAEAWLLEEESRSRGAAGFKDAAARQRAIDTNSIWQLQWYPETPVGCCVVMAPTLEELLELANTP